MYDFDAIDKNDDKSATALLKSINEVLSRWNNAPIHLIKMNAQHIQHLSLIVNTWPRFLEAEFLLREAIDKDRRRLLARDLAGMGPAVTDVC